MTIVDSEYLPFSQAVQEGNLCLGARLGRGGWNRASDALQREGSGAFPKPGEPRCRGWAVGGLPGHPLGWGPGCCWVSSEQGLAVGSQSCHTDPWWLLCFGSSRKWLSKDSGRSHQSGRQGASLGQPRPVSVTGSPWDATLRGGCCCRCPCTCSAPQTSQIHVGDAAPDLLSTEQLQQQ